MSSSLYDVSKLHQLENLAWELEFEANCFANFRGEALPEQITHKYILDRFLQLQVSYKALEAAIVVSQIGMS